MALLSLKETAITVVGGVGGLAAYKVGKAAIEAGQHVATVIKEDNNEVTQDNIKQAKQAYAKSGNINDITDNLQYMISKGYTAKEIASRLNMPEDKITPAVNKLNANNNQNPTKNIIYKPDDVLGLPFRWLDTTDPRRRIYNSTFLADGPIVSFVPGTPKFRSEDDELSGIDFGKMRDDDSDDSIADEIDDTLGIDLSDAGVTSWLLKGQKSASFNKDLRYFRLEQNYTEYRKYLDRLIAVLGPKMGIDTTALKITDYLHTTFKENMAFKFYCNRNYSQSESISNDYSGSDFVSTINSTAAQIQEVKYLLGNSSASQEVSNDANDDIISGVGDKLTDALSGIVKMTTGKNITEITNGAKMALRGYNLYFPDMWKSSSYSKSISLSFTFVSPYGDPASIFNYVYVPFLTLFSMASPRQTGPNAYTSPFLVKVDMPGSFTTDCGVITSMSWKKGGQDNLYSKDGIPLAMDVDITIKDLYPMIMMSKSWGGLRVNNGMHAFLDNMAGLSVNRFTYIQDTINSLKTRAGYILGTTNRIYENFQAWLGRITHDYK